MSEIPLMPITEMPRRHRNDLFYSFAHLHPDFNLGMVIDPNMAHFLPDWNYNMLISKYHRKFWEMVEKHLYVKWPWRYIFEYPHSSVDWNIHFPDEAYKHASSNRTITLEILKKHRNKPWDWKKITYKFADFDTIVGNEDLPWCFKTLSKTIYDLDQVTCHKDKDWDWKVITHRFCSDVSMVLDTYPETPWDIPTVCAIVPSFDYNVLERCPHIAWDYGALSERGDFDWDVFKKHMDKPWCFDTLSSRDDLDWNIIVEFPHLPWNFNILACRADLDIGVVNKTQDKWSMRRISKNASITRQMVRRYYHLRWKGKWSAVRREKAANIIKRHWRRVVSNPYHPVCQRRLLREFVGLCESVK